MPPGLFASAMLTAALAMTPGNAGGRVRLQATGQHVRCIVIAEKPTGAAELAARELAHWLQRATKAREQIPVRKDTDKRIATPAILVGPSRLTRKLGLDDTKLAPEAFVLKTTPQYVVIMGHDTPALTHAYWYDRADGRPMVREGGTCVGTLFGVYTFLQDVARIGWFYPGPLGSVVPPRADVVVPPMDRVVKPDFAFRILAIDGSAFTSLPFPECQAMIDQDVRRRWYYQMRLGQAWALWANHSLYDWGHLFGKAHPEYFSLVNGRRTNDWGWTGKNPYGKGRDFCWAHPATIARQVEEMRRFFRGDTTRHRSWVYASPRAYPIVANDGAMAACECEHCRRWLTPERGRRGRQSDLYAYHLREVAKVAAREFPDRFVSALAYGARALPPTRVTLPENVIMSLATGSIVFHPGQAYRSAFDQYVADWLKTGRVGLVWEYTCHVRGGTHAPILLTHTIAREIKRRRAQVRGFLFDHARTGLSQLDMYVISQLMWDAGQDVDALVDRFCNGLYGPAGPTVKRFFTYLEQVWSAEASTYRPAPGGSESHPLLNPHKGYPIARLYKVVFTPERLLRAARLLDQAFGQARSTPGWRVRTRLDRLRTELNQALADGARANHVPAPARARP